MKEDSNKIIEHTEKKTSLAVEGKGLVFKDFEGMQRFGAAACAAGYWKDLRTVAQATMKLQMGSEVGLKPIQSLNRIHVIEGKPTMAAEAMSGLVKASGKYRIVEERCDEEVAIAAIYERVGDGWELCGRGSFSIKNAQKAGLATRHNWKAYTEDMLWARAVSRACRKHASDVVLGIYAVEDFGFREGDLAAKDQPKEGQAAAIMAKTKTAYEGSGEIVAAELVEAEPEPKRKKKIVKKKIVKASGGEDFFGNPTPEDDGDMDEIIAESRKEKGNQDVAPF
tara:strand:- start:362 stop:1204 length:843 start_codon:yes stop_codon:yes gene_type:complete